MEIVRAGEAGIENEWNELAASDGLCYPLYLEKNAEYYKAYFGHEFVDHSFVIAVGGMAVSGVRVTSHLAPDGVREFSYFGLPTHHVSRPALPAVRRRSAFAMMKDELSRIFGTESSRVRHLDFLRDGVLSDYSRYLLGLGARSVPEYTQVIDLSRSATQLHSDMTKSFRWNVNWGTKNLAIRINRGISIAEAERDLEVLRSLHMEASGRSTRSIESWQAQLRMVLGGEAFIVIGELDQCPVSAALFSLSATCCFYGVSASKRELFDKPLSHALVWHAILLAKEAGCRWFETGQQRYSVSGNDAATEKELGISAFKRNFGGLTHVRLRLEIEPGAGG